MASGQQEPHRSEPSRPAPAEERGRIWEPEGISRDVTPEEANMAQMPEGAGVQFEPPTEELVMELLKEVLDPELGISIVDLGLVYGVDIEERSVRVRMTLTSPGCPVGPMIQALAMGVIKRDYPDLEKVKVDFVWNPPWDPYKMASEEAKDMLGIW
jgi:metal-sulfur cluster biosynthetic enzyme